MADFLTEISFTLFRNTSAPLIRHPTRRIPAASSSETLVLHTNLRGILSHKTWIWIFDRLVRYTFSRCGTVTWSINNREKVDPRTVPAWAPGNNLMI